MAVSLYWGPLVLCILYEGSPFVMRGAGHPVHLARVSWWGLLEVVGGAVE